MEFKNGERGKEYGNGRLGTAGGDLLNTVSFGLDIERRGDKRRGSEMFFENPIAYEPKVSSVNVRWLTTREAAQYLRVSIGSMKTMIYRGQVRAHKLGRRNRFLREELERLITLPINK